MKKYITGLCLVAFFFAGCGDSADPATSAAAEQEAVIELTEEEAQILEAVEAAPAEEAEPVTRENYEEALEALEAELDSDQ